MKIIYILYYFLFISQIKYKYDITYLIGYDTLKYYVHKIYISKDIISHWKLYPRICISYPMGYDILEYTYPILLYPINQT